APLHDDDFEAMLRPALARFDPIAIASEAAWLERYPRATGERLQLEREGKMPTTAAAAAASSDVTRRLWRTVTNGSHVESEIGWLGLVPDAARESAPPAASAAPPKA